MKTCKMCNQLLDELDFPTYRSGGHLYIRSSCKKCMKIKRNEYSRKQYAHDPIFRAKKLASNLKRQKERYHYDEEYRKKCNACHSKYWKHRYETDTSFRERALTYAKERYKKDLSNEDAMRQRKLTETKSSKKYWASPIGRAKKAEINGVGRFFAKHPEILNSLWLRADNSCEKCKTPLVRGKQHSYAVHHIDEDRKNNVLENLMLLCTKCHLHHVHTHNKYV